MAGGFELILACDLVVAGRTAMFGVPEVTLSLVSASEDAVEGSTAPAERRAPVRKGR